MTVLPASGSAGTVPSAWYGIVTTTRSPAAAASGPVAARARGPSCSTRPASVCGPRELLSTTSSPASTASRAMVPPMCPLPMSPRVAMSAETAAGPPMFPRSPSVTRTPYPDPAGRPRRPSSRAGAIPP
jgi:hypothetical protein